MGQYYYIEENGIHLVFMVSEKKEVFFLHCQKSAFRETVIAEKELEGYRLVEVQAAGEDQDDHHGAKYTERCRGGGSYLNGFWMTGLKGAASLRLYRRIR